MHNPSIKLECDRIRLNLSFGGKLGTETQLIRIKASSQNRKFDRLEWFLRLIICSNLFCIRNGQYELMMIFLLLNVSKLITRPKLFNQEVASHYRENILRFSFSVFFNLIPIVDILVLKMLACSKVSYVIVLYMPPGQICLFIKRYTILLVVLKMSVITTT